VGSSTFDVEVLPVNEAVVTVDLIGVFTPTSRCIRFVTADCSEVSAVLSFVDHDLNPSTPVQATDTIEIPCGPSATLCAKDAQHTLWDTTTLSLSGTQYVADSVLSLDGCDTDDDGDCDINDVTLFLFQFGDLASAGGCPWDGVTRDADFSDNGAVGSEDYAFLVANFLTITSCACTPAPLSGGPGATTDVAWSLSVTDVPVAMREATDLDGSGFVDAHDVELFETAHGLPHALSARMLSGQLHDRR
jgi:hypothetical protein